MFEEYQNVVTKAVSDSSQCKKDFETKKEKLAIEIKETLFKECESMNHESLLDYSPIKIHNEITKLKHQSSQLIADEEVAQKKIKETLDNTLKDIMKSPEDNDMAEILINMVEKYNDILGRVCKVFSTVGGDNNKLCRVWFTLKDEPNGKYKKGDPMSIEFVHVKDNNPAFRVAAAGIPEVTSLGAATASRLGSSDMFYMPNYCMTSSGIVDKSFVTYTPGSNKPAVQKWEQWLKENRPCFN